MDNHDIARVFAAIADLLDVKGDSPFKIRAYRAAAETIAGYPEELSDFASHGGNLRDIPGIGDAIAKKTEELLATGHLQYLETLKADAPPGVLDLMEVPGIGPRTAARLAGELGIASVEQLESILRAGPLPGIGEARSATLLKGVAEYRLRRTPGP
ncbi:MAG: helix-hairpin-helix domain-containing protein [Dehalococcoidia bacterium]|jgi:DNA polymerase (family 10)|nr:helix-hairpin-helix domain-containing protein [Dehalococcoidia bacterium]